MQHLLDGSTAICRVCGASRALTRDAGSADAELAAFSAAHGIHEAFRIDIVAGAAAGGDC